VRYSRPNVIDAIRYVTRNGCVWRALPIDFPHPKLVYHYFTVWAADGTLSRIHDVLREQGQAWTVATDSSYVRLVCDLGTWGFGWRAGQDSNPRPAAKKVVSGTGSTCPAPGQGLCRVPLSDRDTPWFTV
jgi:transposase